MIKKRNYSLDLMKAFAIFLVVMDHLIRKSDCEDNVFLDFIYSCHMPLFFFVSGVLAYRKFDSMKDIVFFFAKKCRLLIPVVVFGLGNVVLLKQNIGEFLIWHKFGLWYLWTLFLFFTIYSINQVILIRNENKVIEILGLLTPAIICVCLRKYKDTDLGGVFNFLNSYNYIFFLTGVLMKRYDMKMLVIKDIPQLFFFVVYLIGLATSIPALNIPMKISGVLFAYAVMRRSTTDWQSDNLGIWKRIVLKIGQSSLYIYVLHYYFINGVSRLPDNVHNVIYSCACYYMFVYSLIALFIILTCILISEVLKTNKYIRLIAFGVK